MFQRHALAILMVLRLGAQEAAPAPKPPDPSIPIQTPAPPCHLLDHGLLDPAYFGIDGAQMKESKVADYLWVKPGLNLKGHTLRVTWEDPQWLNTNNDKLDLEVASRLTKTTLPQAFATAMAASLWGAAKVSFTEGDLILTGRIVMINARSSFWSQAREVMTFDLKIVDAETRELLLACHHRFVCHPFRLGGKGKDLELRIPPFALEFSEYCLATMTM
ncbi:MAG TPA: hypothetical protein VJ549_04035 [Geothrix sp.]|nr:hypothetical protein [Geothrix sp.]